MEFLQCLCLGKELMHGPHILHGIGIKTSATSSFFYMMTPGDPEGESSRSGMPPGDGITGTK